MIIASGRRLLLAGLLMASTVHADQQLLASLDQIRQSHNISAVGLVLVERGTQGEPTRISFAAGAGSRAHDDPSAITADTVFRIGSITKGFTAHALLRLQPTGVIALDDRLDTHLDPGLWTNPFTPESPITLAQLLEHSAGFADISRAEWDVASAMPLEDALRRFAPVHQTRWQPGQYASYSNLGAGLVGLSLEKATGRHYEDLVRETVLEPLGMNHSGFDPGTVKVVGHDRDGTTVIPYWHMVYRPFGALNASLADMGRYVAWHLDRGQSGGETLLSERDMQRVETAATTLAARLGLAWGNGLGNYPWLRDGVVFHGHGGDADGYLSRMGYSHQAGRGYFLVINAFNSQALGAMRRQVERFLISGLAVTGSAEPPALPRADFGWLEGDYLPVTARFGTLSRRVTHHITLSQGKLTLRDARGERGYLPVDVSESTVLLRRAGQAPATALVTRQADGRVLFIEDSLNLQQR